MSLKLSALLNPAPSSDSEPTPPPQHVNSSTSNAPGVVGTSSNIHVPLVQEPQPVLDRSPPLPALKEAPAQAEPKGSLKTSASPAEFSKVQTEAQDRLNQQNSSAPISNTILPPTAELVDAPLEPLRSHERDSQPLPSGLDQYHQSPNSAAYINDTRKSPLPNVESALIESEDSVPVHSSPSPRQDQNKMTIDESVKSIAGMASHIPEDRSADDNTTTSVTKDGVLEEIEGKGHIDDANTSTLADQPKGQDSTLQESEGVPSPLPIPTLKKDSSSIKSRSATPLLGESTPKGVTQIKEEETLMPAPSSSRSTPSRATPSSTSKVARKGPTAKKGTVTKKATAKPRARAIDSPGSSRSATPASSRLSKTTNARQSSTPNKAASSPAGDDDEENELYCICRKPDNHTWMIACDGCDDWFHGTCVDMKEENAQLVDKYYCPRCADPSIGKRTTWLRVCRLSSCNQPAILTKGKESKYCSDEHGRAFFAAKISDSQSPSAKSKKRKRSSKYNADVDDSDASFHASSPSSDTENFEPATGGRLGPRQLAKVIKSSEGNLERFKQLGDPVVSSSITMNPTDTNMADEVGLSSLTPSDIASLEAIKARLTSITTRRSLLRDRETFLTKAKETAKRVAREEGVKDLCGYDDRLGWGEEEFEAWRASPEGIAIIEGGDRMDVDGTDADDDADDEGSGQARQVCLKKRCAHHSNWKGVALEEIRFELKRFSDEERQATHEAREIRERAAMRDSGGDEGIREGWVEVAKPVEDDDGFVEAEKAEDEKMDEDQLQ